MCVCVFVFTRTLKQTDCQKEKKKREILKLGKSEVNSRVTSKYHTTIVYLYWLEKMSLSGGPQQNDSDSMGFFVNFNQDCT